MRTAIAVLVIALAVPVSADTLEGKVVKIVDADTIDRPNCQQYFKVTGNRLALEWYASQLALLGVCASPYFTKPYNESPACDMRINGRWQVLHIASMLYRDGDVCLSRKWIVADSPDWQVRRYAKQLCRKQRR